MSSLATQSRIVLLILLLATARSAFGVEFTDPTRPPAPGVVAEEAIEHVDRQARLTSIVISDDRSVAVIDGHLLSIGSRIGDARVLDITPGSVRLLGPDGQYDIPLLQAPIAKRAPEIP